MHSDLRYQLGALERRLRRARLWRQLTGCWAAMTMAYLGLFLIQRLAGLETRPLWWLVLAGGWVTAVILWRRGNRQPADFRALIGVITQASPEAGHLLLTALEQVPDAGSREFSYLQLRVIEEALFHPDALLWEEEISRRESAAKSRHLSLLVVMLLMFSFGGKLGHSRPGHLTPLAAPTIQEEVVVTPGDTQLERGSGLVISARFGGLPPAEASLVLVWASGKTQTLPLTRNLADPVFGASLLEVTEGGLYHVEYGGKQTRDYKIGVFEYPALTRADAELHYPEYTGLTNKIIPDTLRISAVEGTRLTYTLQLNKPVTGARLIGRDETLPLGLETNAIARLDGFTPTNSARYSLELVDADGRTNKAPAEFVFQVLPNRPPEVKITFPRGDQRVSRLEEMQIQGSARDDFGILKYGIGFGVAGQEPQFVELGQSAGANERRQFTNQIALENLGVAADQLVSYFAWADDYGPDGRVRRTFSDIFFAEVRPFDEIFRADQSGQSESQNRPGQGAGQGGNPAPHLAELQKEIVIATWKLQRPKAAAPKESTP